MRNRGKSRAVKAVTKTEHQDHVALLRGHGVWGGCASLRNWKKWNSIRVIWWMPFGNILLKNCFRIDYWLHYHVSSSSHLSCFDTFARTLINLWPLKNVVSDMRGSSLSEAKKNAIIKLNLCNLVHTFCQHLLKNHSSFFNKMLKKCNFQTQFPKFGAYVLPKFYWKSMILFQWDINIGYYYVHSFRLFIFL